MVTTQEVVNLFIHDEDDEQVGAQRTITIRIDQGRLALIDSMAAEAGISRNAMANHLLGLGINDAMAALRGASPETAESILSDAAQRMEGV